MICQCRNCYKSYDSLKARGDWAGFCSAKCTHEKAKYLGYRKGAGSPSEYEVLRGAKCVGDVPVEAERVKLREELAGLETSRYASPSRVESIKRLLKTRLYGKVRGA